MKNTPHPDDIKAYAQGRMESLQTQVRDLSNAVAAKDGHVAALTERIARTDKALAEVTKDRDEARAELVLLKAEKPDGKKPKRNGAETHP